MPPAAQAIAALFSSLETAVSAPLVPSPAALVDMPAAVPVLRRFKLDVSFATHVAGARFSLNDKGEAAPFRERLRRHAPALGLPSADLEHFFALSPPGEVQTTLGVKWGEDGGRPARVSLYFEELTRSPRGAALMDAVTEAFGTSRAAAPPGLTPAAICVDWQGGTPCALKDYWLAVERTDEPLVALPPVLEAFRRAFPLDEARGTRRYLLARRFGVDGELVGKKLLWQSEAHTSAAACRAWGLVPALPPALSRLASAWRDDELFLYPDLVSLDVDAAGERQGLIVYVSVK